MALTHEQDEYLGMGVDIFRFDPWKPSFKARMLRIRLERNRRSIAANTAR